MLEKKQFDILLCLFNNEGKEITEEIVSKETGIALEEINRNIAELQEMNVINKGCDIASKGQKLLESHKVKNAVIMAAGMSSRFVPISYEKPKGLLEVRGEILIERQIRQLHEAGIKDIYIVVGYMMEQFFYLEEKFGVTIVVNSSYGTRNNHGSLYAARNFLGNTYICSSDNYFTENVYEPYVYDSYYAAVFFDHESTEAYVNLDENDKILSTFHGGENHWAIIGQAYLADNFAHKYVGYLEDVYNVPETYNQYWEQIFYPHLNELNIYAKKYEAGIIYEFDSLDELKDFDTAFVNNLNSNIMLNICDNLHCEMKDIVEIYPIRTGQTNTSFVFSVQGEKYVYRHPGTLTDRFINRKAESYSCEIAKEKNLDDSCIILDPMTGYKISKYIESTSAFDFCNEKDIKSGLELLHQLHDVRIESPYAFDYVKQVDNLYGSMNSMARRRISEFTQLHSEIIELNKYVEADEWQKCLCHGDVRADNFIKAKDKYYLIDWEYSGYNDIGYDISRFCSKINNEGCLTRKNVSMYFGREVTNREYTHVVGCFAIAEFYWFVWAVNMASIDKDVEDVIYICYQNAKKYCKIAFDMYKENKGESHE